MTTPVKCRAKNPATCRVHGTFNPVFIVQNPDIAESNLYRANKQVKLSTTIEERIESEASQEIDQQVYDATLEGIDGLRNKTYKVGLDSLEKSQLRLRMADAVDYRKELLAQDPIYSAQKVNFDRIAATGNTVYESYTEIDEDHLRSSFERSGLKDVEPGTPVAVEAHDGSFLYATAGTGYSVPRDKISWVGRLVGGKPSFLRYHDYGENGSLSFERSQLMIPLGTVKKVVVLPSFPTFKDIQPVESARVYFDNRNSEYTRWEIRGKDVVYQTEGELTLKGEDAYKPGSSLKAEKASRFNIELSTDEDIEVFRM